MQSLNEYLCRSAQDFPDKIAVSDGKTFFSYATFYTAVLKLSSLINRQISLLYNGFEKNTTVPIGMVARHDTSSVLALWAILFSDAYYVPLDPKSPKDKLKKIITDPDIKIVLGRSEDKDLLPDSLSLCFIDISDTADSEDISSNEIDFSVIDRNASPDSPAYMVYTSGSTGIPKGIIKSHSAVIDFINAYTETFDFSSDEVIGCQTPFFFDASAKDIYLSCALGATLEIIPEGMFTLPTRLIRYLNEKKVTFISWVPSALSIVTQLNTFEEVVPVTLKKVFFVGEAFPVKHFKKWQSTLPDVEFVNLYGASELAGICCYFRIPKGYEPIDRLPIGKPLCNCELLLAELSGAPGENNVCRLINESHVTGEILLYSKALFSGYFNDPVQTIEKKVEIDGRFFFRTGDLAWYDHNGDLNFASRNDSQIKHMGQRIELGEIEAICSTLDEINKVCCLYDKEKKKIVMFCELEKGAVEDKKSLLLKLKPILSSYMMPQKVVIRDSLPLNANGKIDRQLLITEI